MTFVPTGENLFDDSEFLIKIFLEAIREQHNIFQVLKGKNCQFKIPCPVKIPQELRENQDILWQRKTKRICHQIHTKNSSLNKKKNF